ncbi:hypothetical protein A4R29_04815 [Mesorhizobium ciceri biovar biserrulae]|nr:hypothetical protein A4R29_04815 [Mesorhizobium ciceri biovar biserrulae]
MVDNDSRLLKQSMDIPLHLNRVRRASRLQTGNQSNDNNLAWHEVASRAHAAPFSFTNIEDSYITVIELPCTTDVVYHDRSGFFYFSTRHAKAPFMNIARLCRGAIFWNEHLRQQQEVKKVL